MTILAIDSSMQGEHSVSRQLLQYFLQKIPNPVNYRDLTKDNPAHLRMDLLSDQVASSAENIRQIQLSQDYLQEFLRADLVAIAAPMYNFSIPSILKAWIDRIMIAGKTFRYSEQGAIGLVGNKPIYIFSSRGGQYEPYPDRHGMDHQERYLKTVFHFLGISNITIIRAEGVNLSQETATNAMQQAYAQIDNLTRQPRIFHA